MKKSIAFLGALLFGSVTFGQVTKNDSIKKPTSRKVSADDLKKFPVDSETTMSTGDIKGESFEKQRGQKLDTHVKFSRTEKHTSDASAGKGSMTQKGKAIESAATTEKMHYTIKLTNANKKAATDGVEPLVIKEGATTTQKKHVANFKWSGLKKAKDSLPTPTTKSSDMFLKIGDVKGEKQSSNPISTFKGGAIQKSNATENETTIEKTPLIEKTGGSSSTQTTGSTDVFIKIGDIKGEKDDK